MPCPHGVECAPLIDCSSLSAQPFGRLVRRVGSKSEVQKRPSGLDPQRHQGTTLHGESLGARFLSFALAVGRPEGRSSELVAVQECVQSPNAGGAMCSEEKVLFSITEGCCLEWLPETLDQATAFRYGSHKSVLTHFIRDGSKGNA